MRARGTVLVAIVVLLAPIGLAGTLHAREKESLDDLLAEARSLVSLGRTLEAAAVHGRAVALAHDHDDLVEEERAARALALFREGLEEPATLTAADLAVLEALDPKRAGAYVSAHTMAREILLRSVGSGERAGVASAAEALAAFARGRHRGKAASMLASFGAGLAALGEGADPAKAAEAADRLATALDACVAERWFETAAAVGTELAALCLAREDAEGARAALAAVAEAVESTGGYPDVQLLIGWSDAVRKRLPDAPKEVLAPHEEALKALHGGRAEPGGAGAAAGRDPCVLGPLWKRLGRRSKLVSVERTGSGAVVRLHYVRGYEVEHAFRTGQHPQVVDGIALAFHGHAVSLSHVDLRVIPGAGGGGPHRTRGGAWYLLAEGETWTLRKDGQVVVD